MDDLHTVTYLKDIHCEKNNNLVEVGFELLIIYLEDLSWIQHIQLANYEPKSDIFQDIIKWYV